jgi:hypothetical protein
MIVQLAEMLAHTVDVFPKWGGESNHSRNTKMTGTPGLYNNSISRRIQDIGMHVARLFEKKLRKRKPRFNTQQRTSTLTTCPGKKQATTRRSPKETPSERAATYRSCNVFSKLAMPKHRHCHILPMNVGLHIRAPAPVLKVQHQTSTDMLSPLFDHHLHSF